MKSKNKFILLIALVIGGIDQLIKYIIINKLELFESIRIFKNFNITYVNNTGAAFSILSGNVFILIILGIILTYLFYKYFIKNKVLNKIEIIIYGILFGGVLGNFIDRIFRNSVIDYLDIKIFNYDFPVFNFADIAIVCSIIVLIILIIRGEKNENSNK
ncbi:MAG TPA: signal peptidase II [Bacilli bacterium]|nr:signal peptidase II [Bacilli bacterium]